jgi:outer membrane immunogenic protein
MRTTFFLTAAGLTLGLAGAANAQATDWTGPYVAAAIGYADRQESSGEMVDFDTNLDGVFGDTVRTGAGANAFSPGFCGGSNLTNAAAGGCRGDDDSDVELSVRLGYDWQFGSFLAGGLVEYSQLQLQDSVTAFSTTPAAYTFNRKLSDLMAIRARGGYATGDNLFYVTGGFARGSVDQAFITTNGVNSFPERGAGDAKGHQLGLGAERRMTPNLTLGLEWLRTNLEDNDYLVRATGPAPATNPFILVNAAGSDMRRAADEIEFDSFRLTGSYRF